MEMWRQFAKSSTKMYAIQGGNLRSPACFSLSQLSCYQKEMADPAAAYRAKLCDWRVAAEVVTYRKVEQAINSSAPNTSLGMDGTFLVLLQEGWKIVVPYLVRSFHAFLVIGYAPDICCQVKVVFIPKPSRCSYTGPRDFRPISLTLFLLKTMERVVDRFLRDEALALMPLHPNQHDYQAGQSKEMAHQQLEVWDVKTLDQQENSSGCLSSYRRGF
jgi:hypothetical protein